jgi:hypothetical protein
LLLGAAISMQETVAMKPLNITRRRVRHQWLSLALLILSAMVCCAPAQASTAATWKGGIGNWSDPTKWSGNVVPNNGSPAGATYSVQIDGQQIGVVSQVNMDMNVTLDKLTIDPGDSLSIANAETLTMVNSGANTGIINNGGTLTINSGLNKTTLKINGDLTLSGGGALVMANSEGVIEGTGTDRLTNVDNTISGNGNIGNNSMALTNQALIDANDHSLKIQPAASTTFFNSGTLRASDSGTLALRDATYNNAGGLIRAGGGTVQMQGTSAMLPITGGAVDVVGAGQIQFSATTISGGTLTNSSTGIIRSIGSSVAVNTIGGAVTNPPGGQLSLDNACTLTLLGGAGNSYNNGGNIAINSVGNFTFLKIGGDVTLTGGGTVTMANGEAVIEGATTGTERLTNANNTISGFGSLGNNFMALTNQGTIDATTGNLVVDPTDSTTLINAGTMRGSNSKTLTIGGATCNNSGGLIRANGGTVQLLASTIPASVSGGTMDVVGAGQIIFTGGSFTGGTLTNSSSGAIHAAPAAVADTIGGTVTNPAGGQIVVDDFGLLILQGGAGNSYHNSGNIQLNSTGNTTSIHITGDVSLSGAGTITLSNKTSNFIQGHSSGSERLTNVDNTISGAGNIGNNLMALTNQGKIIANGTVALIVDPNGAANFTNNGTVQVNAGSTLSIGGGDNLTQTAGTTLVNGTLNAGAGLLVQGGTLLGGGTIVGNVNNSGTVAPGNSPGMLTINGNYTQSGTLNIELGGVTPGTTYDQLNVSGTATLAGTLNVSQVNGFTSNGGSYFVVKFGSHSGTFGTLNGLALGNGRSLQVQYNAGNVTLVDPGSPVTTHNIGGKITVNGAGLANVQVKRTNTTTVATTDSLGNYSFSNVPTNTSTILTPALLGYSFTPTSLNVAAGSTDVTGANFAATVLTYTISGRVVNSTGTGMPNVQITRTGASNVVTDSNGNYSFTGVRVGSYTIAPLITPSLSGVTFNPASYNVTVNTSNLSNISFTAFFTVTGRVANSSGTGIPNIQVTRKTATSSVTAITDANGTYTFGGVRSGSYTIAPVVTPSITGISFFPTSTNVTVNTNNLTNLNFAAFFSVSGHIADSNGFAIPNVLVRLSTNTSSTSVSTDSNGNYTFGGVRSGSYTVTPTQNGKIFNPVSRGVTVGTANLTNINFIGN